MPSWIDQIKTAGGVFVTATGTDVGKTVVSALLTQALDADYWKPVQAGLDGGGDTGEVKRLLGPAKIQIHSPVYELSHPLSPHESAKRDGVAIDMTRFRLPKSDKPIVVEGAGGLLVPLTPNHLMTDLISQLGLPVLLVASSGLGTINHTLLSQEALQARELPLLGVILNGPRNPANRQALEEYGTAPILAEVPEISPLTPEGLMGVKLK